MIRRRGAGSRVYRGVRRLALAGLMICCGALAGGPSQAFEPPPGSKNFMTPGSVPNYFSNEAEPFNRGSHIAQPGADRFNTAPIAAHRGGVALSEPRRSAASGALYRSHRGGLAHGGTGRRNFAASRSGRAHVSHRLAANTAYRHSVATRHGAAASRSRYAARGTRHASRSFR